MKELIITIILKHPIIISRLRFFFPTGYMSRHQEETPFEMFMEEVEMCILFPCSLSPWLIKPSPLKFPLCFSFSFYPSPMLRPTTPFLFHLVSHSTHPSLYFYFSTHLSLYFLFLLTCFHTIEVLTISKQLVIYKIHLKSFLILLANFFSIPDYSILK